MNGELYLPDSELMVCNVNDPDGILYRLILKREQKMHERVVVEIAPNCDRIAHYSGGSYNCGLAVGSKMNAPLTLALNERIRILQFDDSEVNSLAIALRQTQIDRLRISVSELMQLRDLEKRLLADGKIAIPDSEQSQKYFPPVLDFLVSIESPGMHDTGCMIISKRKLDMIRDTMEGK